MPVMGGKEFIHEVRVYEKEKQYKSEIPFIVLTNASREAEKIECKQAGADYFWPKPLNYANLEQLASRIRNRKTHTKKILIIDDDAYCSKITQRMLEEEGYSTKALSNSIEALLFMKQEHSKILIIITDANMPNLSGYDLTTFLREFERERGVENPLPVLFMSGYSSNTHYQRAKNAGASEVLVKPVLKKVLLENITRFIS